MLKNRATKFFKRITLVLASMAKAKSLALKSKVHALRTRLMILSLLRDNKKILLTSISQKLHSLVAQKEHDKKDEEEEEEEEEDQNIEEESNAIVLYNHNSMSLPNPSEMETLDAAQENGCSYGYGYEEAEEEKFPDLTHSLFDCEDLQFEDPGGSVIDLVKNSKQKAGEEFKLEDEIDRVADLFIKRFHRQMRMQKQLSIKRNQELLQAGAS